MRELEVLDGGHLKLSCKDRKKSFEEELGEQVWSEEKRFLEEALEAERTDWLTDKKMGKVLLRVS